MPANINKIMFILFLVFFSLSVFSQTGSVPLNQYTMRCYGIDDGLPQNAITDLAINSDGQLIIATYSGVVTFDGYRFSNLIPKTTIPFPKVEAFSLGVDLNGVIWIGTTSSGLYRVDGKNLEHWDMDNGLKSHIIRKIKVVDDGVLINNDENILFFDYAANQELNLLEVDQRDVFLSKFKNINSRIISIEDYNSSASMSTGFALKKSTTVSNKQVSFYLAQKGKVFKSVNGDKKVLISDFNTPTPVSIYNLMLDSNNNLWISTIKNGLFRYGLNGLESFSLLSTNRFSSAVEDVDGNIWVGTSSGLCSLTVGAIKNFGTEQGLYKENIYTLTTDNKNTVYAIPYGKNSQLISINNNSVKNISLTLSSNGITIYEMTTDTQGQTWVATDKYIGKLSHASVTKVIDLKSKTRVLISHENALWFQEKNNLVQYKNNKKKFFPIVQKTPVDIRSLSVSINGELLIGEKFNYYKLTNNKINKIDIPLGLSSCIREFVDGELWGCSDGLWLKSNSQNHHFDFNNSLTSVINGHIHDVRADQQGNIWAISNSGLYRLLRTDLDDYLAGINPVPKFVKFSEQDNIKSSEFNGGSSSSAMTQDGKLWFASQGGVVSVTPGLVFPTSKKILKPFVEKISIGDNNLDPSDFEQIQPNPKAIQIIYGAVFLSDNKHIRFRYKLLPYHQEWHYGRITHIPELKPGTYQLIVQAQYNTNPWSQPFKKQFTVLPTWYQTWYFRTMFILMVIVLLFGIPQLRVKRLKKNRNELKKLVSEQTESLLQANEKLDRLSRIDELTQIPNRREFINNINQLCKDPISRFSLALIDIDDFKAYNDNYGHIAGDECLKAVANEIYNYSKESTLVARFGGEEFVILFDNIDIENAHDTLEKLHLSIANKQLSHIKSTVKSFISLSSGLASRKTGESVESVIERADLAMYKAKTQGKDRIIVET